MDTAILSIILEGDPDVTTYLNKILRTNKLEQQKFTFWFPTPKKPWKIEHQTPKQTWNFRKIFEVKEKEKCNPEEHRESRTKISERFNWTDTLLMEAEKQEIEDTLVE